MGTQYLKTDDGVSLAYQVAEGDGPTLVYISGAISNLTLEDQIPEFARFFERLTRFARVIRFDKRGTGLSDPIQEPPTMERYAEDVVVLLDATGSKRAMVMGTSHGGMVATNFALSHPERVDRLILMNAVCCDRADPLDPDATQSHFQRLLDQMDRDYGKFLHEVAQGVVVGSSPENVKLGVSFLQASSSPHTWKLALRGLVDVDGRPRLGEIGVPTLVVHTSEDEVVPVNHGRCYAKLIPDATYLELESDTHAPQLDGRIVPLLLSAVEQHVSGQVQHTAERVVTSVLFTDIIDSTAQQQAVGDAEWRRLRERFEGDSRRRVEQFGGRVVQFTGDGVMAAFQSPSEALRGARALVDAARAAGVEIRVGVHSGEAYEVDDQLFGTCVTIAARVAAEASASEILTTPVVSGLVEGSGFGFEDAHTAELKGIGSRQLIRLL
jgi:pimeloyl-ACP methyl ester carboxylesterase